MKKVPNINSNASEKSQQTQRLRRVRFLKVGTALRPKPIVDPRTGAEYVSKAAMRGAQRNAHIAMLADFGRLVEERTLGQDPWTQLPEESPIQYERFNHYCTSQQAVNGKMVKRSVALTARTFGVSDGVMRKVAEKWHWSLRAQCWDREVDRVMHEEFLERKRVSVRSQADLGRRLQAVAMKGADNILLTGGADLMPGDVARLADVGVKIERLANGDSTANEARKTETRLVWEGRQPKWADKATDVVEAIQIERDSPQSAKLLFPLAAEDAAPERGGE